MYAIYMYVHVCSNLYFICFIALVTNSLYQWSMWQVCVYDIAQWDEEAYLLLLECLWCACHNCSCHGIFLYICFSAACVVVTQPMF